MWGGLPPLHEVHAQNATTSDAYGSFLIYIIDILCNTRGRIENSLDMSVGYYKIVQSPALTYSDTLT